jgi:ABC-type polar amino acid transport system ATPase subunit
MDQDIIKIEKINKYFNENLVLNDVSLKIKKSNVVVICGPSGCGKSTLLRCLNGLENLNSGNIIINNKSILEKKNLRVIRLELGMVFQQFNLFPHKTVLENIILSPIINLGIDKDEAAELGKKLLKRVDILEKENEYPSSLSGGQQQRVAIARGLAMQPKIMMFDEPTSSLDPEMIKEVLDVMIELANDGMTMIVVTHEMGFAKEVADKIVMMEEGKIIEENEPNEFFDNPKKDRTKHFLSKILS